MNFRQKIGLKIAQMFNINVLPGTVKREDDESGLEWLGLLRGKRKEPTADVTYFTCLKMMSETLAKMPWKYYQETSKGIKKLKDTDESRLLRIRPNPYMTPTIFWLKFRAVDFSSADITLLHFYINAILHKCGFVPHAIQNCYARNYKIFTHASTTVMHNSLTHKK